MRTPEEIERGEEGPADDAVYVSFSFKQIRSVFQWFLSLFLLAGIAHAQTSYCGVDVNKDLVPYGGVAKGTLSNFIFQSQDFATTWAVFASTVSTNTATAPDGTLTADTLFETSATNNHYISQGTLAVTSGTQYRISLYAKKKDKSYIQVTISAGFATWSVNANLDLGTITLAEGAVNGATINPAGNGWYRIVVLATATATTNTIVIVSNIDTSTAARLPSYLGVSTLGTYIWGAQISAASAPRDYIATTTAAVTLGPLCPVGYTQSLTDPSRCFIVGPVSSRTIRTW